MIDYADISSLKGQYFGLNAPTSAIAPLQQQMIKQQSMMLQSQSQELAFQRQKQDYDNAKRRARLEADSLAMIPELNKRLEVFDDPNMSTEDLAAQIGEITMEMAPLAVYSPQMEAVLKSAQSRVDSQMQQDYRQSQRESREEQRRLGLMSSAAQIGDVETIQKLAEAGGIDETEQAYMDVAGTYRQRAQDKAQKESAKEQDAQKESARKEMYGVYSNIEKNLLGLKTVDDEEIGEITISGSDKAPKVGTAGKPLEFDKQSKQELFETLYRLAPKLKGEIEDKEDSDLYSLALRLTNEGLTALKPKAAQDISVSSVVNAWGE